jgi:hypothetical protein
MKLLAPLLASASLLTPVLAHAQEEAPRGRVSYGALSMIASGYGSATGAFVTGGILLLEADAHDEADAEERSCGSCTLAVITGEHAARASSFRQLSTMSFIIGGIGAGVGVMGTIWQLDLAFRDGPEVGEAPTSHVAIGVAPGAMTLHGSF